MANIQVLYEQDIFDTAREAMVCPVNTRGIMGALAGQFLKRWPAECKSYQDACQARKFTVGDIHVAPILTQQGTSGESPTQRWIIFFPTMVDPDSRSSSLIILNGLQSLRAILRASSIKSLAIPALGCGIGGLDFEKIQKLIASQLGDLPNTQVDLYAPHSAGTNKQQTN